MKVDDNDTIRIITVTYEYIIPWYHYPIIVSYSEWLSSQSQLFTIATQKRIFHSDEKCFQNGIDDVFIWAMVNTHYMVDGHPIHNKDPYNGYYNPYKPLDD